MQRILINTSASISVAFEVDGVAQDPDPQTAMVTITGADGTVLVSNQPADRTDVGRFKYDLAAETALLDTLTASWTSSLGTLQTTTEVVGGYLFTIARARGRNPLSDDAAYPTQDIMDARTWAEQELENACGAAFVPRYALETITPRYRQRAIRLGHRRVRRVRSLSIDGTVMDPAYIASLLLDSGQLLRIGRFSTWACGHIIVGYEHGYDTPPAGAELAALDLAADRLISDTGSATIDPRATRIITEDGEIRLRADGRFGIPSVDRFVTSHREPLAA